MLTKGTPGILGVPTSHVAAARSHVQSGGWRYRVASSVDEAKELNTKGFDAVVGVDVEKLMSEVALTQSDGPPYVGVCVSGDAPVDAVLRVTPEVPSRGWPAKPTYGTVATYDKKGCLMHCTMSDGDKDWNWDVKYDEGYEFSVGVSDMMYAPSKRFGGTPAMDRDPGMFQIRACTLVFWMDAFERTPFGTAKNDGCSHHEEEGLYWDGSVLAEKGGNSFRIPYARSWSVVKHRDVAPWAGFRVALVVGDAQCPDAVDLRSMEATEAAARIEAEVRKIEALL